MDKIAKALKKLRVNEREKAKEILLRIKQNELTGLDVKKLKGRHDIYRVRFGIWRIIYRIGEDGVIHLIAFDRKNDNTYNF